MEKIKQIFNTPQFKHHVYGLESHGLNPDDLNKYINRDRFSYIFSKKYDSFKINDARMIKSLAVEKTDRESIFIISFTHINNEAQNTLLKLIEEPKPKTTFFFIFPNTKKLLPTIQSRMEIISLNKVLNTEVRKIELNNFIKMSLEERFNFIKKHTGKVKKGESSDKKITKADLHFFLDDLEIFFYNQKKSKKRDYILKTILESRKYTQVNSVSIKIIIDMISLYL